MKAESRGADHLNPGKDPSGALHTLNPNPAALAQGSLGGEFQPSGWVEMIRERGLGEPWPQWKLERKRSGILWKLLQASTRGYIPPRLCGSSAYA